LKLGLQFFRRVRLDVGHETSLAHGSPHSKPTEMDSVERRQ